MSNPEHPIRARLTEEAIDYVLAHGLTDLSLRPLAAVLGTNARMLVYHFGSRQGLMKAILEGLRRREDAQIDLWFRSSRRRRTFQDFLRWYWGRISSPQARSAAMVIFELYALALRDPRSYPGVLQDPVGYWTSLLKRTGLGGGSRSKTTATLLLAATRGLLLDFAATGDRARTTRALTKLLDVLET